jgi:hypothetical protein
VVISVNSTGIDHSHSLLAEAGKLSVTRSINPVVHEGDFFMGMPPSSLGVFARWR